MATTSIWRVRVMINNLYTRPLAPHEFIKAAAQRPT
jgi:hypothetical protein